MTIEGSIENPSEDAELQMIGSKLPANGNDKESVFSPRFKSVAAMAGWDEEALLIASLVVDDTPEREFRLKKRSDLQFKSPPSDSRRKRRVMTSSMSIPVAILDLDEEETTVKDDPIIDSETAVRESEKSDVPVKQNSGASSSSSAVPCMDKLREELSCAICLEICFKPSTTPCGHSFCKKCLRSAADKCGKKCPKCRQLISNGRSCTVNTVLWNTIQLLFPQEVEARKEAKRSSRNQEGIQNPEKAVYRNLRNHGAQPEMMSSRHSSSRRRREIATQEEDSELDHGRVQRFSSRDAQSRIHSRIRSNRPVRTTSGDANVRSRRGITNQDEDAALALRLQREEFLEAFRDTQQTRNSQSSTRVANLRALASRANLRISGRYL